MEIDIKRGYEVLPNNNVVFGIRITNNTELVISDVQVILDYNESLFKLQGETVQKLDSIPPKVPRTARFVLKPLGCVHKENIEATITYRNHKWEKRIVTMQPKHVHCVCPFLRPKAMEKNEFLHLSENGDSIESGINFQGVSSEDVTSFLMQTCATRLYVVESYSIGQDQILYFSGESVGEKNYYLLTALIKENNGTIRVMLRATSNKKHGINGFINEIIAELRHLVDTVNSSREIGIIKHEQVINIIDSVVQRSHISTGNEGASINVKDSVVQRRSHNAPIHEPLNNNAIPARKIDNSNENENSQEAEISNMYNAYLEEVEAKRAGLIQTKNEDDNSIITPSRAKQQAYSERGSLYSALRIDETEVKKRRIDRRIIIGIALIAIVISMYHFAAPLLENNSFDIKMALSTDSYIVGSKITNFLDAVNEGDTATAYKIYGGSDLLAPSAIALTFSNNGIDPGCIIDVNTTSKKIYKEQAVVATECNVSIRDPYGQVSGSAPIHVYFKLYDTDKGWMITTISFDRPLTIDYNSTDTESLSDDGTAGRLAVKTTSSSLMVKNIEGIRAESVKGEMADTIDLLKLTVGLNVGSDAVDMKDVVISVNHDKNANILIYAGNNENEHMMKGFSTNSASQNLRQLLIEEGNSQKYFVVEKIRDEDASFSLKDPVINSGDLITVYIATVSSTSTGYSYLGSIYIPSLSASGLNIVPRTTVNIVFTPESGSITSTDLTTPSSYGTKETVQLFP